MPTVQPVRKTLRFSFKCLQLEKILFLLFYLLFYFYYVSQWLVKSTPQSVEREHFICFQNVPVKKSLIRINKNEGNQSQNTQ